MIELEYLEQMAEQETARAQENVDRFKERFGEHPADALEWSLSGFESVAKIEVLHYVLRGNGNRGDMTPEQVVVALANRALTETVNGARWPKRSTSPTDHLMDECMTAAWAQLFCDITERI